MEHAPARSTGLVEDGPAAASPQGLIDSRALACIAVERTRMPMVVTDPRQADNPIVLANAAFLDMTGYGAEEVIGRNCRFLQGAETDAETVAEIGRAICDQRGATVEILNYRKDGTSFWNQLFLSPIHDDDGQLLYYFGSQLDVTQRRKAQELEAAEHRLLREIDHRAMNVLAIVEGVVRLTRADDAAQYAASVQARVQALSKAHVQLAAGGWRPMPLEQLIQAQAQPFGAERIVMSGPETALGPNIVQPVALVVHELLANAAAHGALACPEGLVLIDWRDDPDQNFLEVSWNEVGGPPPSRNPAGFGFKIISAIVERQLGGELSRRWQADGLNTALRFPRSGARAL